MWDLQGFLLYRSIEHRNEKPHRVHDRAEDLIPYIDRLRDPRIDPEEAKKIAA